MGKKRLNGCLLRITPKLSTANKGNLGQTESSDGAAQWPLCSLICYLEGRRVPITMGQNVMSGFFYGAVDVEMTVAAV